MHAFLFPTAISVKDSSSTGDLLSEGRATGAGAGATSATSGKLSQLRYGGYSAEFLDRVATSGVDHGSDGGIDGGSGSEPNGNIPHKQAQGKFYTTSSSNSGLNPILSFGLGG